MAESDNPLMNHVISSQNLAGHSIPPFAFSPAPIFERQGPNGDHAITPGKILDAIRCSWKFTLPAGLALAAVAIAVLCLTFKPSYEATAWVRIEEQKPFLAYESREGEQSRGFVQTQVELFRTPMILSPVVARPDIAGISEIAKKSDPVDWLSKEIKVKQQEGSELFKISFACSTPSDAQRLVNAVVDEYFRQRNSAESARTQRTIELLTQQKERRAKDLVAKRQELRKQAMKATGNDLFAEKPDMAYPEARTLTTLQERMIEGEVEEELLKAKLKALEEPSATPSAAVDPAVIELAMADQPQMQKFETSIAEKKTKLAQLESLLARGAQDPRYQQHSSDVAREEQSGEKIKEELRQRMKAQAEVGLAARRKQEIAALQSQLDSAKVVHKLLQDRYQNAVSTAQHFSGETLELKFRQDELVREEKVHDLIADRVLRLVTEQAAPLRVTQERAAIEPTEPLQRLPYTKLLLTLVGCLCLPFGVAVVKEQITQRVFDSDTLEQQTHLAVIGEIAHLPSRSLILQQNTGRRVRRIVRLFEESVDALRTNLLLSSHLPAPRVLLVTSSKNREGKTSVAVQLAMSIARTSRKRTLIIDADTRSPRVHNIFGIPATPGLVGVLRKECPLASAIYSPGTGFVDVLPAGKLVANPYMLFSNEAVEALLSAIPDDYGHVIIDTPPLLAASETLVLAKAADACLMCAMRSTSHMDQVKKATERLLAVGGRLAGIVLCGVPTGQYIHRYGTYPYA